MSRLPSAPSHILNEFGRNLQTNFLSQFKEIEEEGIKEDSVNEAIFRSSRALNGSVNANIISNVSDIANQMNELLNLINHDPVKREMKLSQLFEKFAVSRMFQYFLSHGTLAPQSEVQPCNDDEYIGMLMLLVVALNNCIIVE